MGIHTQANFGKVAKGSNAYFSGLYRGIVGGLRSNSAKWCRDCWAMDEAWPLNSETCDKLSSIHTFNHCVGGGRMVKKSGTYSPWWSAGVKY